ILDRLVAGEGLDEMKGMFLVSQFVLAWKKGNSRSRLFSALNKMAKGCSRGESPVPSLTFLNSLK
ncbi:MAG: hypothetical protein ACUVWO_12895, partial [Thermodesulfobacteriota bacterium]